MSSDIYTEPGLDQKVENVKTSGETRAKWRENEVYVYESVENVMAKNTTSPLHEGQPNQNQPQVVKGANRKATICKTTLWIVILAGIIILTTYFTLEIKLNNSYNQLKAELLVLYERKFCSDRWTRFKDKCYFKSTEKKSWSDSRRQCQDHGADLVIINSREEQNFVAAEMIVSSDSWIGLESTITAGGTYEWTWVDGSPLTEEFWEKGWGNGDYQIHAISCTAQQKCNALPKTSTSNWICEK